MRKILLLLFAAALTACKPSAPVTEASQKTHAPPPERILSGQVFITQRNGQSVKLGGVTVAATEFGEASKFIEQMRSDGVRRLRNAQSNTLATARQARSLREYRNSELKVLETAQSNTDNSNALAPFWKRVREANERLAEAERMLAFDELTEDHLRRSLLDASFAFQTNWPGLIRTATSDADGNFKLSAPIDRQVLIVASAKRQFFDKTERYGWAVAVGTNSPPEVLLSNQNTLNLLD